MLFMPEVSKVYCTLYTEASRPSQGEGYLKNLLSCGSSYSPLVSLRMQLCYPSWTLQTTKVIDGKMHCLSPILKSKGALINPVILTYLQTKLHPPYPNQTDCLSYFRW